jgi:hypothetical protein
MLYFSNSHARTWSSSPPVAECQNEANILNPIVLTKLLGVSVLVEDGENSAERRKDGIVGGQSGDQRRLVR